MKTTIELPDALLSELKEVAHEQGVTMKELITTGLRAELDRRRGVGTQVDFVFPVFGGEGQGLLPGIDPSMFREIGNDREWLSRDLAELDRGQDVS